MTQVQSPLRCGKVLRPTNIALLALVALGGCRSSSESWTPPASWTVHISSEAPPAVRWTAEDVVTYLGNMGFDAELVEKTGIVSCAQGQGQVVFAGNALNEVTYETKEFTAWDVNAHGDTDGNGVPDQLFRIEETRCGEGALVSLAGGGLLGRQYAAYDWLHQLGVRFFHPEEEYVPAKAAWSTRPLVKEHLPPFRWRGVSLHLTHPIALGDVFRRRDPRYLEEGLRYIDWQIKNLASIGKDGVRIGDFANYGLQRGLANTSYGLSLHNQQQGGSMTIDPDDPRSEEEQIKEAIDSRMKMRRDYHPKISMFTFNPSEFTEVSDTDVVRQITFLANHMAENYPDVLVQCINHGTYGEPTENYGVRYYALPQFAPPNLGVMVKTMLFYDLFRPAPIYGNENFNFQYDFMVQEYQTRRIWYGPESAWWLTFDNAVPLYLPITIEARDRDLQNIAFMLEGQLDGHYVLGTGHEWGYWQNEYCSLRMAMDLNYRYSDCLADITGTFGGASKEVQSVVLRLIELQERDIIYGDVLPYLAGTDRETEVAYALGIEFHPLSPPPREIMNWDVDAVTQWRQRVESQLMQMVTEHTALLARLEAVATLVPETARPFFDEIYDGIDINRLRAKHALEVYGAVVTLREAQLQKSADSRSSAIELLQAAKATTQDAIRVVHRREQGYRYAPLDRYIAGGPDGTQDENWSIYSFRVHNRAHHGFYYTRIDNLVEEVFAGAKGAAVDVQDALLGPGEELVVNVSADLLTDATVNWGDGTSDHGGTRFTHSYDATAIYDLEVSGTLDGGQPYSLDGQVATMQNECHTGFSGKIVEPSAVSIAEDLMPALVFGTTNRSAALALGFDVDGTHTVSIDMWTPLATIDSSNLFETVPVPLVVPVVNRADGSVPASLMIDRAVLMLPAKGGQVTVAGSLSTDDLVAAVVAVGGFEPVGARALIASILGFTAQTLPPWVDFVVTYDATCEAP